MSFKDLTTRAAALLKLNPAETTKTKPATEATKRGSKKPPPESKKS